MRLWQILAVVLLVALILAIARTEVGRVALIVFFTGLGEIVLGLTALMHLFKTIGMFGEARTLAAHVEALLATAVVLLIATISMDVVLWAGLGLLQQTVRW